MKRLLITVMVIAMAIVFCSCGSEEPEAEAYSPSDIQVEKIDDTSSAFSVIYDITVEKEAWSGYPEDQRELMTAVNGIKECMSRDEWTDTSVVYGCAQEPKLSNVLYSYGDDGSDGDYESIKFYQLGIYNTTYILQDELQ